MGEVAYKFGPWQVEDRLCFTPLMHLARHKSTHLDEHLQI